MSMRWRRRCVSVFLVVLSCPLSAVYAQESPEEQARRILDATGVRGGLVVHLNCGDGKLTAALRTGDAYLVHGLARNVENLAKARERVRQRGLYGPVSVDLLERDAALHRQFGESRRR